jgi:hypothetical protein
MKALLYGAALVAANAAGSHAAGAYKPRYDHALEKAAASIVADKIGDIRGSFAFNEKPRFVLLLQEPAAQGVEQADAPSPVGGGVD